MIIQEIVCVHEHIKEPLQTILLDCKATLNLLVREENFQKEFEKLLNDSNRFLSIINTFLSAHIFPDGEIKLMMDDREQNITEYSNTKKFYLQCFIASFTKLRKNIAKLIYSIKSMDMQYLKQNQTIFSLLKHKLNYIMFNVLDSARYIIKVSRANLNDTSFYSSNDNNINIISSDFLLKMKSLTEYCCDPPNGLNRVDFADFKKKYIDSFTTFIELTGDCLFDISKETKALTETSNGLLEDLGILFELTHRSNSNTHGIGGFHLDMLAKRSEIEKWIVELVDKVKIVIPQLVQCHKKQPSDNILPNNIPLIGEEPNLLDGDDTSSVASSSDISTYSVVTNGVGCTNGNGLLSVNGANSGENTHSNRSSIISNNGSNLPTSLSNLETFLDTKEKPQQAQIITTPTFVTSTLTSNSNSATPSVSIKEWDADLPKIVLSLDQDEEEDQDSPVIWSMSISQVSSDPFNNEKQQQQKQQKQAQAQQQSDKSNDEKKKKWFRNPFKKESPNSTPPLSTQQALSIKIPPIQTSSISVSTSPNSSNTSPLLTPKLSSTNGGNIGSNGAPNGNAINMNTNEMSVPLPNVLINQFCNSNNNSAKLLEILENIIDEYDIEAQELEYFNNVPVGLQGKVEDKSVEMFDLNQILFKDYVIEGDGHKSKRFTNKLSIEFDHNEKHIAHYHSWYQQEHYNYLGFIPEFGGNIVISIKKEPDNICNNSNNSNCNNSHNLTVSSSSVSSNNSTLSNGSSSNRYHKVIIRTKNGTERLVIKSSSNKESDLIKSVINYLKVIVKISSSSLKINKSDCLVQNLLQFELENLKRDYSFFVAFQGEGQNTESQILSNEHVSREFTDFYRFLGKQVPLKNWKKFAGELDTSLHSLDGQSVIYNQVNEIEVVFKISHMLSSFEKRKEILNKSQIIIVYHEGKQPFNPNTFNLQNNQTLIVIKKVKGEDENNIYYKLGVLYNNNMAPFTPMIPEGSIFKKDSQFLHYFITKCINAQNSYLSSQLNQTQIQKREYRLNEICSKKK
ncbi:hypothetical protein DICPUDRAFT_94071 [Dictyostelium purpureum]|uniref:Rap-GAP domain-containing protein n=1 Tax=Dictyostelium purpureum TaxID=5786 RepID=F0ZF18_DICPU|nr:uncharacterized protein DICPUDRAFT_94071 [Dictyostelium purpureum]EGC37444.1 hypothetical protein DICPUDRAFT_94071 [Dictyostelium purpureum]|eukprot:XP_003286008.1 hypothetical protein DICPUDRAFT_94071 [Dictyostelium purpureum]